MSALRGMDRSLDALMQVWERDWREQARHELNAVAASIERHCRFAEAPDGLITQLERDVGHSKHVSAARLAHRELTDEANALVRAMSLDVNSKLVRERAGQLLETLRRHLALEADLVYDLALESETGIGD